MPRIHIKEYIATVFDNEVIIPSGTIQTMVLDGFAESTTILTGVFVAQLGLGKPLAEKGTAVLHYQDKLVTDHLPLRLLHPIFDLPSQIRVNEKDSWSLAVWFEKPLEEDVPFYVAVVGARLRDAI